MRIITRAVNMLRTIATNLGLNPKRCKSQMFLHDMIAAHYKAEWSVAGLCSLLTFMFCCWNRREEAATANCTELKECRNSGCFCCLHPSLYVSRVSIAIAKHLQDMTVRSVKHDQKLNAKLCDMLLMIKAVVDANVMLYVSRKSSKYEHTLCTHGRR